MVDLRPSAMPLDSSCGALMDPASSDLSDEAT